MVRVNRSHNPITYPRSDSRLLPHRLQEPYLINLVTQRLKGSGMAWTMAGGQTILTLRSLLQSGRWGQAWPLLAADFRPPVVIPDDNTEVPLLLAA